MGFVKNITKVSEWEFFTVDHTAAGYMRLCGALTGEKSDVIIYIKRNGEWLTARN